MTALEQIIKEAKRLRRKYPHRFKHLQNPWRDGYMKQASAIYASKHKGRSPVGKKKRVSNVETKSKSHVDKNRITANIQVGGVSDLNDRIITDLRAANERLRSAERRVVELARLRDNATTTKGRKEISRLLSDAKRYVMTHKQNVRNIKKNIR